MKKLFLFSLAFSLFISCQKTEKKDVLKLALNTNTLTDVLTVDYNGLKPHLNKIEDKIYVVNFWATWCGPCVKELPYFEQIGQEYKDKNVEVLLVSLDFPKQKEKKLIPFINKKNLQSEVILLDDTNEQVWIKDISENWTGAIPATLIYNKDQRKFFEKSFTKEELETEIKSFINKEQ